MKSGIVCLIGRPNAGKSTLVNNLLKHKVSITSPKPQTTRFAVKAVYEDERGQIIFIDTPGIFAKAKNWLSKKINPTAEEELGGKINLVLYIIDHTRARGMEENKVLGLIRKTVVPKILVINKIDIKEPDYIAQYRFIEREVNEVIEISALYQKNLTVLLERIFAYLPEGKKILERELTSQPVLNIDSKTFLAELIREKAFLFLRREIPYSLTSVVDEIVERESGNFYIRARLITNNEKYKGMIVGKSGSMIKEIGLATRKEIETATNRRIFLDLTVEVDPHWIEYL